MLIFRKIRRKRRKKSTPGLKRIEFYTVNNNYQSWLQPQIQSNAQRNFLHQTFLFFYAKHFSFFTLIFCYTKNFVWLQPQIQSNAQRSFLHQFFCFFYTKHLRFCPNFLLHQKICMVATTDPVERPRNFLHQNVLEKLV